MAPSSGICAQCFIAYFSDGYADADALNPLYLADNNQLHNMQIYAFYLSFIAYNSQIDNLTAGRRGRHYA